MEKNTNIFTKGGDKGMTTLKGAQSVSKTDNRIQLLGSIDELTSNLGVVKAESRDNRQREMLNQIQKNLMTIMAGIADPFNQKQRLSKTEVESLELEINRIEGSFPRKHEFILPGECMESAHLDVARTVARRAERWLIEVAKNHPVDGTAKEFMNRLSDYLYVSARWVDYHRNSFEHLAERDMISRDKDLELSQSISMEAVDAKVNSENLAAIEAAVAKVLEDSLKYMDKTRISLAEAKKLIEKVEAFAVTKNKKAVISVCGPDGNMIAVHVMDDAFLASFDISMKKAYTSVAVKMSTMELSKLAQPGQTFYGVESTDGGRIVIFGGGVPLKVGGRIIGGLGVSGGTGEEDHELAEYGLQVLSEVLE
ncbi:MAG: cob(I)yrinic acid a,c-diamide adenosyltransferase [Lachnospiraceae bacterium]|jgi:ATP:cob(I)alamin adenosyltransferase|nr:cob(I)yrinic acid a,c-diamide adenosyltransferase [Lachnospiraceae bacterium]MDD3617721.1 cob(I)yrinic acid a,c-diamide adenosyltransferase [Lachnospiraceae bacterium]